MNLEWMVVMFIGSTQFGVALDLPEMRSQAACEQRKAIQYEIVRQEVVKPPEGIEAQAVRFECICRKKKEKA